MKTGDSLRKSIEMSAQALVETCNMVTGSNSSLHLYFVL